MRRIAAWAAVAALVLCSAPAGATENRLGFDPCRVLHDPAVARALGVRRADVVVAGVPNPLHDGMRHCNAGAAGSTATIDLAVADAASLRAALDDHRRACTTKACATRYARRAAHLSVARDFICNRLAGVKKLAFESDDGTPVAHLGDRAFTAAIAGVYVLYGGTEFVVGVTRRSAAALDAEGVLTADTPQSVGVARALLARHPANGAAGNLPHDCTASDLIEPSDAVR